MGIRYRRDSNEMSCSKTISDPARLKRYEIYAEAACMRRENHPGDCIALACDAAKADGVCFGCRNKIGFGHKPDCFAEKRNHD